jgi:hypothetical protein
MPAAGFHLTRALVRVRLAHLTRCYLTVSRARAGRGPAPRRLQCQNPVRRSVLYVVQAGTLEPGRLRRPKENDPCTSHSPSPCCCASWNRFGITGWSASRGLFI